MDRVTLQIRRGGADNKSTISEGATPFHPFTAVAPRDLQASTTARSDGEWDGTGHGGNIAQTVACKLIEKRVLYLCAR